MPTRYVDFRTFPHRNNSDGTVDSICPRCFMTIATSKNEAELSRIEAIHKCDPGLLCRSIADSDDPDESNDKGAVHHTMHDPHDTSKSIH